MTEAPSEPEMSWAQVLDLVTRLDSSDYADVELEMPGLRLRMSTTALPATSSAATPPEAGAVPAAAPAPATATSSAPAPAPAPTPDAAETGSTGSGSSGNLVEVIAPMLGTFYCRPSPDKEPYVTVGAQVTADTTVGIVEVMKLMNQVEAGAAGTVVEVLAADGDLVEHGQVLVRIDAGADS